MAGKIAGYFVTLQFTITITLLVTRVTVFWIYTRVPVPIHNTFSDMINNYRLCTILC